MNSSYLHSDLQDHVRVLTLNRPEKRNALNTELVKAILAAVDEAEQDAAVHVVLLTGTGSVFCAGIDVNEFRDSASPVAALAEQRSDALLRLLSRFSSLRCPVIAAINGTAIGAGAALALAADLVVMSNEATLGYPETKKGFVPSLMVGAIVRNVGRKAAFELLAFGDLIDAEQAKALGLINRVVNSQNFEDESMAFASTLSTLDPAALQNTKRLFSACVDLPLDEALRKGRDFGRVLQKGPQ